MHAIWGLGRRLGMEPDSPPPQEPPEDDVEPPGRAAGPAPRQGPQAPPPAPGQPPRQPAQQQQQQQQQQQPQREASPQFLAMLALFQKHALQGMDQRAAEEAARDEMRAGGRLARALVAAFAAEGEAAAAGAGSQAGGGGSAGPGEGGAVDRAGGELLLRVVLEASQGGVPQVSERQLARVQPAVGGAVEALVARQLRAQELQRASAEVRARAAAAPARPRCSGRLAAAARPRCTCPARPWPGPAAPARPRCTCPA
jgi:hypothetical protein